MLPSLARRNPIVVQFSQWPQHSCRRFLFFCANSSLSTAFCLVVHQHYDAGTNAHPRLCIPFHANIHKAITCKYLSKNICTVVKEWIHGYLCLGYFSSSTHIALVTLMAQKVWRLWVLVFVYDRHSHARNCIGLLSNTGLFLSTGSKYRFLLQRHSIPFDS